MVKEDATSGVITDCDYKAGALTLKTNDPGCRNGNNKVQEILKYVSVPLP